MTNTYDQSVCLMPLFYIHSVHWGINPPTTNPPSLLPSPLYLQTVQALLFRQSPLCIGFL